MCSWSISNVVINAHWKWIWLLENHSDSFSEQIDIHSFEDILSVKKNFPVNTTSLHKVIHTVDATQKR